MMHPIRVSACVRCLLGLVRYAFFFFFFELRARFGGIWVIALLYTKEVIIEAVDRDSIPSISSLTFLANNPKPLGILYLTSQAHHSHITQHVRLQLFASRR